MINMPSTVHVRTMVQSTPLPLVATSNCPQLAARDGEGLSNEATDAAGTLLCLSMVSARGENLLRPSAPAHRINTTFFSPLSVKPVQEHLMTHNTMQLII